MSKNSECTCTMAQKLAGDGCETCNPERAKELKVYCSECKHFNYLGPTIDQPYPEFWCSKGIWDGISSYEDLYEAIDCEHFCGKERD